jgi:hypothetical protein
MLLSYVLFLYQTDDVHISFVWIMLFYEINWHLSFILIVTNPPINPCIIIESMTTRRDDEEEKKEERKTADYKRLGWKSLYFFSSFLVEPTSHVYSAYSVF